MRNEKNMKKIHVSPSAGQSAGRATSAGHVLTDDDLARGCFCRKPK